MEKRPSRNCILELNKKTDELKEKDIVLITVHATDADRNILNDWLKEYNVSLPLGMIKENPSFSLGTGEEKTKFNWGVKALPWLILTDKEHVITSMSENNEREECFLARLSHFDGQAGTNAPTTGR